MTDNDKDIIEALRLQGWEEAADRIEQSEAKLAKAMDALEWACNTLKEINPRNYAPGDVCYLNDASVEVILGIRAVLAELEGKND